jgi:hypothetical protein
MTTGEKPMTIALDYAHAFEIRRRRPPRALVLAVWAGLFLVKPRLAVAIWRERRQTP